MSEIKVQVNNGPAAEMSAPVTVAEALKKLDRDLAKQALAARVDGREVDLAYTIESQANGDAVKIEPVLPQTVEGLDVLRHSTAHLLAAAVLDLFPGTKLGIGPALLEDPRYGFFYDVIAPRALTEADLPIIEKKMRDIAKRNMSYRRDEIPKAEALRIFNERDEPLKCELIDEKAGEQVSVYYIDGSPFLDFCLGPHVPNTNKLKAFKLLSLAGAYWKGDAERPQMQRIYGTAFFTQEELDAWLKQREEAEKRDHRKLGRELDLFSIQEQYGQGLVFWHPKGGIVRQQMEDYLREELIKRNYSFVYTPHIAKRELWQTSGHEQNYGDSMFAPTTLEETEFRLKPMNCPFHIMIYKSHLRSYRDLPIRYGELGTVYRYERTGVLHGLLRVRGFTQDDAHLFCRPDQIESEVSRVLDFTFLILGTFGFTEFDVFLSTKPEKSVGSEERWAQATSALEAALKGRGVAYQIDPGEGVFYGPKIDIKIKDALGRSWQCSTIQIDFNNPERFELGYIGEDGKVHQPIMIHRALMGSIERFFGILIEHFGGAFPTWLAPVQALVMSITDNQRPYVAEVVSQLKAAGFRAEADLRNEKIGLKIREAEKAKVPFMFVVGDREVQSGTLAIRGRSGANLGSMTVAGALDLLRADLKPAGQQHLLTQ